MESTFSPGRLKLAVGFLALVIALGTMGFREIIGESWISAFYRSMLTVSLTGIDTRPPGHGAQLFTIG
ncbi:MAG: hypothetical protein ACR2MU_02340, partial [Gaiellaceae bacterium]